MDDREILLDIVRQLTEAHTGTEFTKHWSENALWFDVPAFASRNKNLAIPILDEEFGSLKDITVTIVSADVHVIGAMGFVAKCVEMGHGRERRHGLSAYVCSADRLF